MTYEIYRYIFLGGAILAGIMLAVSVLVFFLLKIPTVIGDLTGANARKAIENIRSQNESTGNKAYQTSLVNKERGKLTDKISPSGRIQKNYTETLTTAMGTEKLEPRHFAANETEVLSSGETAVLASDGETTVLAPAEPALENGITGAQTSSAAFVIEYEITYIHTDEVIA